MCVRGNRAGGPQEYRAAIPGKVLSGGDRFGHRGLVLGMRTMLRRDPSALLPGAASRREDSRRVGRLAAKGELPRPGQISDSTTVSSAPMRLHPTRVSLLA